jgi:hypothetical protein
MGKFRRLPFSFLLLLSILAMSLGSCTRSPTPAPTTIPVAAATTIPSAATVFPTETAVPRPTKPSIPIPSSTATSFPFPSLRLDPGEFFFRLDDQPSFLFSRNIAGYRESDFGTLLDWSAAGGTRIVRIQLDCLVGSLGLGFTSTGAIDETWARQWERIFDRAEEDGVYVLPVFSGWFDWNGGPGYSTWKNNQLNAINGGPAQAPTELFEAGSATQAAWLAWMEALVKRWQGRKNIAAWEIFSEVNLASGPSEAAGIDFVNQAAALIRSADTSGRAVTASIADTGTWNQFYAQTDLDFIEIHPYPPSGQLDRTILTAVRQSLGQYHRPVLIGESGLSADTPDSSGGKLTVSTNAARGARHAIWAAVVSGAMNGRALYWEDGYGIFFQSLGIPWLEEYRAIEYPVRKFVNGIDFSGFIPITTTSTQAVWGAAVGNGSTVLGWFRDSGSEPPNWAVQPLISKQTVTLSLPGSPANWKVDFYDPKTGTDLIATTSASRNGDSLTIALPDFSDDIAFKLTATGGTIASTRIPTTSTAIAGTWSGTISNTAGTFSTTLELSIQADCAQGAVCGTFQAPHIPCSGDLLLQEISDDTFVFIEQNTQGAATCKPGGIEILQLIDDGKLQYNFAAATGAAPISSGKLQRQ